MTNKEKYRLFCEAEKTISIFSQAWWLDSVCGDAWDVCLVEKNGQIHASMPYGIKKRYGFTLLTHPLLTQNLGPWFRVLTGKYGKILSQQKDLMEDLIEQLPSYDYFNQSWHYSQSNWLAFYWKGFRQTTRYTYVLEELGDLDRVWMGFQENVRREVRKAKKKNIIINVDLPVDDFINLNRLTFVRQGMAMPYSEVFLKNVTKKALERQQCKWFIAQDEKGQNHAGVFIIWDENSAYYLMGGGDPELRNSGATSLCMWEAIQFAATVTQKFDFEGSMIEPIERFFRGFGAVQKPFFSVSKTNSKMIAAALCLRSFLKP